MGWTLENGTVVGQNLTPTSKQDRFPTHLDIYGRGGYKAVTSSAERDAIPISRLCLGAEVRVTLADGNSTVYYVSKMPDVIVDTMTGADCEWTAVESGGLDEDALTSLKGQPGGLAELDADGKVPESQSRSIIFRGTYIDETTFNSKNGTAHVKMTNAIYIDNSTGRMYSWSEEQQKFLRDTVYWQDIV